MVIDLKQVVCNRSHVSGKEMQHNTNMDGENVRIPINFAYSTYWVIKSDSLKFYSVSRREFKGARTTLNSPRRLFGTL